MARRHRKTPRKRIYKAARSSGFTRRKSAGFSLFYKRKTGRKR